MDRDGRKLHDARSLHAWLGVGRRFTTWFSQVVRDYGFREGEEFLPISGETSGSRGGRTRKDYLMTATMAKEVAMIGNTPVGVSAAIPTKTVI